MKERTPKRKGPRRVCECKAYAFPHRVYGGACEGMIQEIHRELYGRPFQSDDERKADEVGVPAYGPL